MLLRVINPIIKGKTWYERWGYNFHQGGFNIKRKDWRKAAINLRNVNLEDLMKDFSGKEEGIIEVIKRYMGSGEHMEKCVNLGEWLNVIILFKWKFIK